jgi:hypothetical protein
MTRKNKFVLTIETDRASDISRLLRLEADHLDKYPLDDMPLRSFKSGGGGVDNDVSVELNSHLAAYRPTKY